MNNADGFALLYTSNVPGMAYIGTTMAENTGKWNIIGGVSGM